MRLLRDLLARNSWLVAICVLGWTALFALAVGAAEETGGKSPDDEAVAKSKTIFRHGGPVWAAAFSPMGETVLTGSDDKTARLWDVAGGEPGE